MQSRRQRSKPPDAVTRISNADTNRVCLAKSDGERVCLTNADGERVCFTNADGERVCLTNARANADANSNAKRWYRAQSYVGPHIRGGCRMRHYRELYRKRIRL